MGTQGSVRPVVEEDPTSLDMGRALIVEPDSDVRAMAFQALHAAGLPADAVQDVSEALVVVRRTRPDVILLSAVTNSLTLDGVLSSLRTALSGHEVPIAVMIDPARDGTVLSRLRQPFDEILCKPLHPFEVVARVRSLARLSVVQRARSRESARFARLSQELEQLAERDPLTGTYNRRYFQKRLNEEILRTRRYGQPLTLVMVDVDHFKQINDRHGHVIGDIVLRAVADTLTRIIRTTDILARFGGEEFVVLAPSTDQPGGQILAERLRASLGNVPIMATTGSGMHATMRVTASFGVVTIQGRDGAGTLDGEGMIEAADIALYRAKQNGRNRVESHEE